MRLNHEKGNEHQRYNYSSIYGKIIYPVAISPLYKSMFNDTQLWNIEYNRRVSLKGYYQIIR